MNRLSLVAHHTHLHRSDAPPPVHVFLESLLDGAVATARIGEAEIVPLLAGLAHALCDLAKGARPRAVVRLCATPEPWELGLTRVGRDLLVTVFSGGPQPIVARHERRIDAEAFIRQLLGAMEAFIQEAKSRGAWGARSLGGPLGLIDAHTRLCGALPVAPKDPAEATLVPIEPTGDIPLIISADVYLRASEGPPGGAPVVRADLLSLLFRGRLRVSVGGHARDLADTFVFLVAEQLVTMTLDAVEAGARGRALHRRSCVSGSICGVRVDPKGGALLTLGSDARGDDDRARTWTFPAVDVAALAQGVVAFGRALARSLVRRDRAQAHNLRLIAFRGHVRDLAERARATTRDESKINASPESYRAFAASQHTARPPADLGKTRIRFTPRWVASVPSIDLRSTFLCGDVLVVGATRELTCLHRQTADVLWRKPMPRGITVVSPMGLARLEPDGVLTLHDLASGETLWNTKLTPRLGATASGAVVNAPGLPRLLVVSEGARHLSAVDLQSGDVRWRHAGRRGGAFLVRRAGKLVVVANGEPALTALDVVSGEVVWRLCDPLGFASHVAVGGDALLAVAGGGAFVGGSGARLYEVDPWSGERRWSADLPAHAAPVGGPLLGPETAIIASYGRRGTELFGFDRKSGKLLYERAVCTSAASCMVVDDAIIVNSEGGELCAIDAGCGATRYRHVLSSGADGDRPRRLEPVLRSGALFVPQGEVHVVRPRDGTLLGRVPTDLVPDLLRVDERCDVYVVEESGHLAAFGAGARLTLVQ